jgi:glycosyltransferase involved in cell wall biosynthesis
LQHVCRLHAYYFCADRTPEGFQAGYPVSYFANVFPYLASAITDTERLAGDLRNRYGLTSKLGDRVKAVYTPAVSEVSEVPVAAKQVESAPFRKAPVIVWAGRFDRQKRFDLLLRIAGEMPEVVFKCWGAPVLDQMPSLDDAPENLIINSPFNSYSELELDKSDGFLYTSAWDGLPTILIELGALGVPIVASAVGGVPELIDENTGWLVAHDADVGEYVAAIREMLSEPNDKVERARKLSRRVANRHNEKVYSRKLQEVISVE